MRPFSSAIGLVRLGIGLPRFLRTPISIDEAKAIIRRRMRKREKAFSALLRAILAKPRSPYSRLFRAAGCELGDVERMIEADGLEGALEALAHAGVYVASDEFKGRAEAVRGSERFDFREDEFDNHLIDRQYLIRSGGSHGRPTRIPIDLNYLTERTPGWALWFASNGWLGRPLVFCTPFYVGVINRHLITAKLGSPFVKWFSSGGHRGPCGLPAVCVHALARRAAGFPRPEPVPLDEVWRVGTHLASMRSEGLRPCVLTTTSGAVRVCLAMRERGVFLEGVTFIVGSEPLTQPARHTVQECGAEAVPSYGTSEAGTIGCQCPNAIEADDVHVFKDAFAITRRTRDVGDGRETNALLATSLLSFQPKLMLNVEIGDTATLETRRCGCLFDEFGYLDHLYAIRSYEKLTGEGVTFYGTDLAHLLGEVLPGNFGGTLADYQLQEESDGRGITRYRLMVGPDVGQLDDEAVVTTFLDRLGRINRRYRFMADQWKQADLLKLSRDDPVKSATGKVLPFRTLLNA